MKRRRIGSAASGRKGGADPQLKEIVKLRGEVEKLKVRTACHDIQIQALYEAIRRLSETPDRVTMFPAITYPAARQHRRPDIQSS